ncbi:hypothetical protein [uncultured Aquimarina sp.]|uniref:hypothetical protein n=1 Tax=uncultured Aquimarina sp. TaxID=575652 RepID=UPI00262F6FD2|nr:hypothetical protein [uncultured Aquimarina sp.]
MNRITKNSVLVIVTFLFITAFNSKEMNQEKYKEIKIETLKKGPFKYYQAEIQTVKGLEGAIYLNDTKLLDIEKSHSDQLSSNQAQDLITNGTNEIRLEISSINEDIKKDYFSECVAFIAIHGVSEKIFPSKETQIIRVKWNPEKNQKTAYIKYVFELKR